MKSKKDLWGGAAGDAGWATLVPPAPGDLRIVQAMVNTTAATKGTDEMASPQAAVDGALGALARIVVVARMQDVWRRLKLCRGECGLSYYDASARCLRRWCAMERCGNRAKVRAYRRRKPRWLR